jgi:hypothetical protein
MSFWLTTKLNEKCACGSGKAYRTCCMRLEIIFLVIGTLAALILFFGHGNGLVNDSVIVVAVLLFVALVGWLAKKILKGKK